MLRANQLTEASEALSCTLKGFTSFSQIAIGLFNNANSFLNSIFFLTPRRLSHIGVFPRDKASAEVFFTDER